MKLDITKEWFEKHLAKETGEIGAGIRFTHRHLKSGHLVRVIGTGKMQSASWIDEAKPAPVDMREVVVYEHDGNLWVRPVDEFNDGRFEAVAATASEPDEALNDIAAENEAARDDEWGEAEE